MDNLTEKPQIVVNHCASCGLVVDRLPSRGCPECGAKFFIQKSVDPRLVDAREDGQRFLRLEEVNH